MRLQILSDLHNEFYGFDEVPDILGTEADVIVLAGDIDLGDRGVRWAAIQAGRLGKPVIYVPGNHEYYGRDLDEQRESWTDLGDDRCVHVLDDRSVILDGVRFLGSTLWTDYRAYAKAALSESLAEAKRSLQDHRLIKYRGRVFSPENALELHKRARAWIECELGRSYAGNTVLITHHGPAMCAQHPNFSLSKLSGAFWSDLSSLMNPQLVQLWIYGHTHACVDTQINGVRVVSNQFGYYRRESVQGFRGDFVVEI